MNAPSAHHPTDDTLRAYGLGKLGDPDATAIDRHLETCPDCRQRLAGQSGDSFVGRLRGAHGRDATPDPERTLPKLPRVTDPPPAAGIPPELAGLTQYADVRELGRGGMGVVYLAKNTLMDRPEVLKVVNRALLASPGAVERFLREVRSAARLQHPNVVAAYAALPAGDLLVFAMEYVPGDTLADLVKARGPFPVANACYYAAQVAQALQHAHERGMVHRDVKPSNLILAKVGGKSVVKVLDFGLAKATSEKGEENDLTGSGRMLGTPDYIAPEQITDAASADIRADVYSLGCTLYCLLAGRPPFAAGSLYGLLRQHHEADATALNLVRPEVPVEVAGVVARMMAKDPRRRYQTPAEVAKALAPFAKPGAGTKPGPELSRVSVAPPAPPPPVPPPPTPAAALPVATTVPPDRTPPAPPPAGWKPPTVFRDGPVPQHTHHLNPEDFAPPARPARGDARKPRRAAARRRGWPGWAWPAAVAAAVVLAVVGAWAAGVFKLKTKDGTIVVEVSEPDAEVLVDGEKVTVTWDAGRKRAEIRVRPGTHAVEVRKDGFVAWGTDGVAIEENRQKVLTVTLERRGKPAGPVGPADGFVPLFNGKDLTGWKEVEGQAGIWSVQDRVLVGRGTKSHLFTTRDDYTDVHVKARVRINDRGNSGVYVRVARGTSPYPIGYEGQINATGGDPNKTGSLYVPLRGAVEKVPVSPVGPDVWFTLEVIVEGNRIRVFVDGVRTADYFDPDRRMERGAIGLQVHDPQTVVEFASVEVKELTGSQSKNRPGDPVRFFNREDLTGWKGLPGYWHVEGGAIVGRCPPGKPAHTFLFSDKRYKDFDLKFEARRLDGIGNSGVQFRSSVADAAAHTVVGPQCEIDSGSFEYPPGSLVTEPNLKPLAVKARPEVVRAYRDDGFNAYQIRCVGKHVTIRVNGEVAVDDDFPSLPDDGVIAWQIHGRKTPREITFRNIEFTDLGGGAAAQPGKPDDPLKEGSVWVGNRTYVKGAFSPWTVPYELHVTKRDGTKFSGHMYDNGTGRNMSSVEGELTGAAVRWTERSGHTPGWVCEATGTLDGTTIQVDQVSRRNGAWMGDASVKVILAAGPVVTRKGEPFVFPPSADRKPPDPAGATPRTDGFVPLFNGKDLTGWKTHPSQPGNWHVVDGILTGSGPEPTSHLYTVRDDYKDFYLRLEARLNAAGNSGVYFRAPFGPTIPPDNPRWLSGHNAKMDKRRFGGLVVGDAVVRRGDPSVPPGRWFTFEVTADGKRITVKVDGAVTAEYTDDAGVYTRGHIVLQQHTPDTVAEFRKIEIKELP